MAGLNSRLQIISGNTLKLLAAFFMVLDHVGYIFFPQIPILRYLGRLALPIFAYMIAEGCKYTRNRFRYLLTIFTLGTFCQVVYYIYDCSLYMCILITFSMSILVIYAMQYMKKVLSSRDEALTKKIFGCILFIGSIVFVYLLNNIFVIDYGFWGCMLPVFAAIFRDRFASVLAMGVGLAILCMNGSDYQIYSLCAIPILMMYSGQKGRYNMKYFFYVFYPLHLAILQMIDILLK